MAAFGVSRLDRRHLKREDAVMEIAAQKTTLESILPLRQLFLQEANHQIRYNACHERGWSDSYMLAVDGADVGYGSIKGREIPDRAEADVSTGAFSHALHSPRGPHFSTYFPSLALIAPEPIC